MYMLTSILTPASQLTIRSPCRYIELRTNRMCAVPPHLPSVHFVVYCIWCTVVRWAEHSYYRDICGGPVHRHIHVGRDRPREAGGHGPRDCSAREDRQGDCG